MSEYYYLNEDKTVRACSLLEYIDQMMGMSKSDTKHVDYDFIGEHIVSTVWLGLNHNWDESGPPLVLETMVFEDGKIGQDIYRDRYSTWDEAVQGHKKAIEWVKNGCKDEDERPSKAKTNDQ